MNLKTATVSASRVLRILHPFYFQGYLFQLDVSPATAAEQTPELVLKVKRDPGTMLILSGGAGLALLLCWYFLQTNQTKKES